MREEFNILRELTNTLKKLDQTISDRDEQYEILEIDFPDMHLKHVQYTKHKKRLIDIQENFNASWLSVVKKLDLLCKRIRKKQPYIKDLNISNINTTHSYPSAIVFGHLKLSYENWIGTVPKLFDFPFRKSFWLYNTNDDIKFINQFLFRIMYSLPIKLLNITVIDPIKLGGAIDDYKPLLKLSSPFKEKKVLTRADEIEKILEKYLNYMEDLIQKKFINEINDWIDYNISVKKEHRLSYSIVLLFGVPEQITTTSQLYIKRLIELGPKCGILPILMISKGYPDDRVNKDFIDFINKKSFNMHEVFLLEDNNLINIELKEKNEYLPSHTFIASRMNDLYVEYEKNENIIYNIKDLWKNRKLWDASSVDGVDIPIGWTQDGKEIVFSLGGVNSEHHALIAGRSGSGKSNLLHVLINSLTHKYSPNEVEVYLLDYKQGTEFNTYIAPILPQASLVAVESSPEYGVVVLRHLVDIINGRALLFKEQNVTDMHRYKEKTNLVLSRILVIIDEFQILFTKDRLISEEAEKLLTQLLRQGRSYGIHIILATQTLKGIQTQSIMQLMSQIGCRLALACSEEDSSTILGGNSNYEASTLKSPPEGILNDNNGSKKYNQRFNIPFAEPNTCAEHQKLLHNESIENNFILKTKIYNGSTLPKAPDIEYYKRFSSFDGLNFLCGETLSFESEEFILELEYISTRNLLIVGPDTIINEGLLSSIVSSMSNIEKVAYINSKPNKIVSNLKEINKDIAIYEKDNFDEEVSNIFDNIGKRKQVLIINGLDYATILHSAPNAYRSPSAKEQKLTPAEEFKAILETGSQNGTFVVAFVDNWKRCAIQCRENLHYFDLRIGFSLSEDDAGSLVSGNIGKFKGLEKNDKAIFIDRLKNEIKFFRPYIKKEI